jgi:hypothetical protein
MKEKNQEANMRNKGWIAVRQSVFSGERFIDFDTLSADKAGAVIKAEEKDKLLPAWSATNPWIEIKQVKLIIGGQHERTTKTL